MIEQIARKYGVYIFIALVFSIPLILKLHPVLFRFFLRILTQRAKSKIVEEPDFHPVYTANGLQLVTYFENLLASDSSINDPTGAFTYSSLFGNFSTAQPAATGTAPETHKRWQNDFHRALGIEGYEAAAPNTLLYRAGNHFTQLVEKLNRRYQVHYNPLPHFTEQETLKRFGLNLLKDELLYDFFDNTDWQEEKVVSTTTTYDSYRNSQTRGSGYHSRFGTHSYINRSHATTYASGVITRSSQSTYDFLSTGTGRLYITNKRLLFIGNANAQNKTIKLDDILQFIIYENGLLLGKSRGKKPLVAFSDDGLALTTRFLDRIISGTQNQQLPPPAEPETKTAPLITPL